MYKIYMYVIIFIDQRLATQQINKILHLFNENSIIHGLLSWKKLINEINGFFHFIFHIGCKYLIMLLLLSIL